MMIEAACCLLDTAEKGPPGLARKSHGRFADLDSAGSGELRSGWGTPVYHLAHLGFFERLVSLGFAFHCFDGAPTSSLSRIVLHLP